VLAPIRLGVGLRAGASLGYIHYTKQKQSTRSDRRGKRRGVRYNNAPRAEIGHSASTRPLRMQTKLS